MKELGRPVRILAFAGSLRDGSFNQTLLDYAIGYAREAGADVTHVSLGHFPAPVYDANLQNERGIPTPVFQLYERIKRADAVMIASPEYNAGYTPLLKNAIDWLSRVDKYVFLPRKIGLLTASPGGTAGAAVRAQTVGLFERMFVRVHDETFGLPKVREKTLDGVITDEGDLARLRDWVDAFVEACIVHALDPPEIPES